MKLDAMIACNNVSHLVEIKPTEHFWGMKFVPKQAKIGTNFFFHFIKFCSLVFLSKHGVIAWNIVQLLIEVKPMEKKFGPQIGSEISVFVIFSKLGH